MPSSSRPAPPQHAPALGLTHRLLGRFHVTGFFWYRFAFWGFTRLPSWTEWVSVPFSAMFFFFALGRIRGALASNLEPILGRAGHWERWRRAYRTIWAFSWCFAERYRRLADPERFRSVIDGAEHWRQRDAITGRSHCRHRPHRSLGNRGAVRGLGIAATHPRRAREGDGSTGSGLHPGAA